MRRAGEAILTMIAATVGVMAVKTAEHIMGQLERKVDSTVEKCPHCDNEFGLFRWRHVCDICGETVCADCLTEHLFEYCPTCMQNAENTVETYSVTYKGNKYKPCTDIGEIETNWFRRRDNALKELKMRAARLGCDVVYNVNYDEDTENEGNYFYSVWQATGIAAKKD
jgi:uncharacterized protein YbjQ (UPF0145 family)